MTKIFNGAVYDVDTNKPVVGARIYSDTVTGVVTDDSGNFSLAADDSLLSTWFHIDATAQGYGDYVQQLGGLEGDIFIYNTSAGAVSKIKAAIKNSFWSFFLTVLLIVLILFIAKKYLHEIL